MLLGIQSMWVGPELVLAMPEENQEGGPTRLPLENAPAYPLPSDVLFVYFMTRRHHG